jgi:hypothetical protein
MNMPDQVLICEHLKTILEAAAWRSLDEPTVFTAMTLWDPETQALPLITILPRIEKSAGKRYGKTQVDMPVEITALVPLAVGDSAIMGLAVADEIAAHIFRAFKNDWESFPDSFEDIDYVDGGIISYPDELNPQMLTAGVTLSIKYTKTPFPDILTTVSVGAFQTEETLKGY